MTDWTTPEDVPTTTVDRLHRWLLQEGNPEDAATPGEHAVADIIRAFWPVPPRTLAEELRYRAVLLDNGDPDGDTSQVLRDLADHASQMKRDLTEAHAEVEHLRDLTVALAHERNEVRAEVERLTARNTWPKTTPSGHNYNEPTTYKELRHQCANGAQAASEGWDDAEHPPEPTWGMIGLATAEVERLTAEQEVLDTIDAHYDHHAAQKGAETTAETPTPADIQPGEAWLVEVNRQKRTAVKDNDAAIPWNTITTNGVFRAEDDDDVTLVTRLVPAPRTITNPDDLDRAKRDTIIRDSAGVVCSRDSMGNAWTTFTSLADQRPHITLPATVLWEPGA